MKRCFFLIGYWIVHLTGTFPVTLKTPNKKKEKKQKKKKAFVSFRDPKTFWSPWTTSRRGFFIGILQIFAIINDDVQFFTWYIDTTHRFGWNRGSLQKMVGIAIAAGKQAVTLCSITTSLIYRGELERLVNDVSSLYFRIFERTDPPKSRRFAYLVVYAILSFHFIAAATIVPNHSQPRFIQKFICEIPYTFTVPCVEVTLGVILVYIQSAVEGLNREIKRVFPHVDSRDWKYWEPVSRTNDNGQGSERLRANAKSYLTEYRRTYRSVANIIDQLNSMYGFLLLSIMVFNQISCLLMAFSNMPMILENLTNSSGKGSYMELFALTFGCLWCFVRIFVMLYSFEIVLKEVQVTKHYIATIDASKIDQDSKIELLEFLEEIDGREIRFMASNIFALDYAAFYVMLTNTVTYIVIVIQLFSP